MPQRPGPSCVWPSPLSWHGRSRGLPSRAAAALALSRGLSPSLPGHPLPVCVCAPTPSMVSPRNHSPRLPGIRDGFHRSLAEIVQIPPPWPVCVSFQKCPRVSSSSQLTGHRDKSFLLASCLIHASDGLSSSCQVDWVSCLCSVAQWLTKSSLGKS